MLRSNRILALLILLMAALLVSCAGQAAAPPAAPVAVVATAAPTLPSPTLAPAPASPTPGATAAPPTAAAVSKVRMEKEEITSQALAGNLLGDPATRKYLVLLPPSYDTSDKHYPVVYGLHYYTGEPYQAAGDFMSPYEEAVAKGAVQEMIFVFPDATNELGGGFYLSSPTIGDYDTYVTQELVKAIDAKYRTIPDAASRGITGCSMGGDGSMRLALKHPDVFGVAAPAGGRYDWAHDGAIEAALSTFKTPPKNLMDFQSMDFPAQVLIAEAAGAAPNPNKPPFYLDMPVEMVNGEVEAVPQVLERIAANDSVHALKGYLAQPKRLNAILIYHSTADDMVPVKMAQDFDKLLTDQGLKHEYMEVMGTHCNYRDGYKPVVAFMSKNLVGPPAK